MPSYLDLGFIVVVLISALLSMVRGFTREVLAIVSWGAAAAAAYYFYPRVLPFIKPYIAKDTIALGVAVGAVFFITLIIISIITVRISDAILDSKVGALDRTLGFVFGAGRGLLLCAVAFLFFAWLMQDKPMPDWAANAKTRPMLEMAGKQLQDLLPADSLKDINSFMKKQKTAVPDEPPAEPDAEIKPPAPALPPTPAPVPPLGAPPVLPPPRRTEIIAPRSGVAAADKQKLDALLASPPAKKP